MKLRAVAGIIFLGLLFAHVSAWAQLAPTPRRSPRTPVSQQKLGEQKKPSIPASRVVTGSAKIVDAERLRIGEHDMRLFGVVPPQLSAPYGPQARAVLDSLAAAGSVTCTIRDRDRDSRLLATCRSATNADLALELLRRGLAATARGSLHPTELAPSYEAAEKAAQSQKLGLWSVALPSALSESALHDAIIRNEAANTAARALERPETPKAKPETPKVEAKVETAEPVVVTAPAPAPAAPSAEKAEKAEVRPAEPVELKLPPPTPTLFEIKEETPARSEATFYERYQFLIASALIVLAALGASLSAFTYRWFDRRREKRSIAAALRGELTAARAICQGRIRQITTSNDEKACAWPRIRTLVFQACVARLGLLGSLLSRQIASIYGQASDYAAYYNSATTENKADPTSKLQALCMLVDHIDEVLPKLAAIEGQHVQQPKPAPQPVPSAKPEEVAVQPIEPIAAPPPVIEMPERPLAKEEEPKAVAPTPPPAPPLSAPVVAEPAATTAVVEEIKTAIEKEPEPAAAMAASATVTKAETAPVEKAPPVVETPRTEAVAAIPVATDQKAAPLWNALRRLTVPIERTRQEILDDADDDVFLSDYPIMTEEEELEALAYSDTVERYAEVLAQQRLRTKHRR